MNYHYAEITTTPQLENIKTKLEQESHLFIICLGMLIGTILSLFIGYHLNTTLMNVFLLLSLPVALTYCLRKIYIHTLIHYQE
nr:FUSC family protein [Acinetobacter sp. CFCC 10889]